MDVLYSKILFQENHTKTRFYDNFFIITNVVFVSDFKMLFILLTNINSIKPTQK